MPRGPKYLEAGEEPVRDPKVHPRVWGLPRLLERLSREHDFFSKDLQRATKTDQPTISKLMNYKNLASLTASMVLYIEEGLELPPGTLLPRGEAPVSEQLEDWGARLGLDRQTVLTLQDKKTGTRVKHLPQQVRGAVIGIVHVRGVTLEQATRTAEVVMKRLGKQFVNNEDLGSQFWYDQIGLSLPSSDESGTHVSPSRSKIKLLDKRPG